MKRFLAILLTLGFASTAAASTVRGRVLRPNGSAYPGAQVTLENAVVGKTATVQAAEDGVFILRNVPPGQYTMLVATPHSKRSVSVSVTSQPTSDVGSVQTP